MKTKNLTLFGLFFLCIVCCSWGQENQKLDSLIQSYETQADNIDKLTTLHKIFIQQLRNGKISEAKRYVKIQLKLAEKLNSERGKAKALGNLGIIYNSTYVLDSARYYYEKSCKLWEKLGDKGELLSMKNSLIKVEQLEGNYDKALEMYDEAIEMAMEIGDGIELFWAKRDKATVYMEKGNYELALREFLFSLKVLDTLEGNNQKQKGDVLIGIGRIEGLRENYNTSVDYLNEALEIFIAEKNTTYECITNTEIGLSLFKMKEYDKSLEHFKKALEFSIEMERDNFIAISYANIGMVLVENGNPEQALDYLNKSLKLNENSKSNQANIYSIIGDAYKEKDNFNLAIKNYTYAIKIADSIGSISELKTAYENRALVFEKLGQYNEAFTDQKEFQILNDSIFNTNKSRQIEELRTIYETEKKEQQLALQDKEITVLEQEVKISNQQKLLLGGGMTLSLLALGFGFYGFRQKTKRNQLEKDKVEAELAFKKKELTTHALHLAKKNEVLENVKLKAKDLKLQGDTKGYQELIKTINFDQQDDKNWESFTQYFEQVHKDFAANVQKRYPDVTKNELRFMALLKMNMSSKEIATILNISPDGIKKARQRLRKKMALTPEISLENTVLAI